MPFTDPATGAYPTPKVIVDSAESFTLRTPFRYQSGRVVKDVPAPWKTDFATIPKWLWGFLAPYGKQTIPAILHDYLCDTVNDPDQKGTPVERRRDADNLFHVALQDQANATPDRSVSRTRARLFWAGVTFGRYQHFKPAKLVAIAATALVFSVVLYAAPIVLATTSDNWVWPTVAAFVPSLILGTCAATDSHRPALLLAVGAAAAVPVLILLAMNLLAIVLLNVIPFVVPLLRALLPGDWSAGSNPEIKPTQIGFHIS